MSVPLHQLAAEAPAVSPILQPDGVSFPFSNDALIDEFRTALSRTDTPEWQSAKNRVALLIGESALISNIRYIPEETIVLLDSSEPMLQHMTGYVDALRTAPDPIEWQGKMGMGEDVSWLGYDAQVLSMEMLYEQMRWWEHNGEPHPAIDPESYQVSQRLAREKAIIPWKGDITSHADMQRLGEALRKYDAAVTLLNLTNVIPFTARLSSMSFRFGGFAEAADYTDRLAHLPVTSNAPILTTSTYGPDGFHIVESTGPWYGLEDLSQNGGDTQDGPVAVRPGREVTDKIPSQRAVLNALVQILEGILGDPDRRYGREPFGY